MFGGVGRMSRKRMGVRLLRGLGNATSPLGKGHRNGLVMTVPVQTHAMHQGKMLVLDCHRETLTLLGSDGQELGTVTWDSVVTHIQAIGRHLVVAPPGVQSGSPLAIPVRYRTPDGRQWESRASRAGASAVFIETSHLLPVGTEIIVEMSLPALGFERLEAKGRVAWVCPKRDQYDFSPGLGVTFVGSLPLPE